MLTKRVRKPAVIVACVALILLLASPLRANEFNLSNLTVSGASPGGLWSALGAGLDKAVNKSYPRTTVTYQTSSGGLANAKLVADGKVHMGIVSDMELKSAWEGTGVFKDRPQQNIRVLFRLFNAESRFQAIHIILNRNFAEKHGITSFADIVAKKPAIRVAVNRPGNMDGDTGIAILDAAGVSTANIQSWGGRVVRAATREQTGLMTDRRLDMINFGVSFNHSSISEMGNAVPLMLLDLTEPVAAKVVTAMGGKPCVFKKNEYPFLEHDAISVCTGAMLVVNSSMDDDTAYAITKAMLDNLDSFKDAHPQLARETTPETIAEGSYAPWHPGAERAFREAGLLN